MINYKEWNLKELGNHVILGAILLAIVLFFMIVIVPILSKVHVVFSGFGLVETLLFFILLKMMKK
jgi:hypothetical protein